jgi:uncharacterized protein YyaL (SSP411 family)
LALAGLLSFVSAAVAQAVPPSTRFPATTNPHAFTNRLIHEESPYLLLHAHNPVDWYPWGEEAFAKARRENKPIFLSVGYYTCHWCHVMERESYSNPEIAKLLNRWFVAVKVDREERPDVDQTYMNFIEATTGSGGWPMNVFLTPELKPFFGGTYFPPESKYGQTGLKELLPRIAGLWSERRADIERSAHDITGQLQKALQSGTGGGNLGPAILDQTFQQIKQTYDAAHPGFGGDRKFPRPVVLEFLLRYWVRTSNPEALDMTLKTLRAMAAGGIHDQLGGGFHRYSTDAAWRVPHFEKMLYDQAQLAMVYVEAFQVTHDPFFADNARDILDFTLREMRDPAGGFYSALDADSPVRRGSSTQGEGAFYAWTAAEIESVLGPEAAAVFEVRYGVQKDGNVPGQQDIEGWLQGKNVLYQEHTLEETAQKFGGSKEIVERTLTDAGKKLLASRAQRPRPPADTKVIAAWNGMMVSALARASQALGEPRYRKAAEETAALMKARFYQPATGRLRRRYRGGSVEIDGYLDDYAWVIRGALDLYEADFDARLLSWAVEMQRAQDRLFWNAEQGGYFNTAGADRNLLWRPREAYDGAEPAANSVAALNLLRLWQLTDQPSRKEEADKTLAAFSGQLQKSGESLPLMAAALDMQLARHRQIVIAGAPAAPDTGMLLQLVHRRFLPNAILLLADGGQGQREVAKWLPVVAHMTRKQGRATAYICENYVCNLPTADPQVVERILDSGR